jgi:hypothetical protein
MNSVRCRLATQHIEQPGTLEHLANPRRRIHDSQHTIARRRHVECPNQLADAGGIDARHCGHVYNYAPLPTKNQGANVVMKYSADGHLTSARDGHRLSFLGRQLENY